MLCAIGHYLYCRGRNTNDCLHLHLHLLESFFLNPAGVRSVLPTPAKVGFVSFLIQSQIEETKCIGYTLTWQPNLQCQYKIFRYCRFWWCENLAWIWIFAGFGEDWCLLELESEPVLVQPLLLSVVDCELYRSGSWRGLFNSSAWCHSADSWRGWEVTTRCSVCYVSDCERNTNGLRWWSVSFIVLLSEFAYSVLLFSANCQEITRFWIDSTNSAQSYVWIVCCTDLLLWFCDITSYYCCFYEARIM